MKKEFGLKQLIILTIAYLAFVLIDFAIDYSTGVHWTSPNDFRDYLGLIAVGFLWIWYFVDKFRKK